MYEDYFKYYFRISFKTQSYSSTHAMHFFQIKYQLINIRFIRPSMAPPAGCCTYINNVFAFQLNGKAFVVPLLSSLYCFEPYHLISGCLINININIIVLLVYEQK